MPMLFENVLGFFFVTTVPIPSKCAPYQKETHNIEKLTLSSIHKYIVDN